MTEGISSDSATSFTNTFISVANWIFATPVRCPGMLAFKSARSFDLFVNLFIHSPEDPLSQSKLRFNGRLCSLFMSCLGHGTIQILPRNPVNINATDMGYHDYQNYGGCENLAERVWHDAYCSIGATCLFYPSRQLNRILCVVILI